MSLINMIIAIILIGIVSSLLASLMGLGGGLVAIPLILLVVGGQSPNIAKLISYVNLTFITLISGFKYYRLKRKPDWNNAIIILLGVMPMTIIASIFITPLLNNDIYKPYFHIAYVIIAFSSTSLILYKEKIVVRKFNKILLTFAGMIIGLISGSVGLSGGILFIPLLVIGLKMSLKQAAITSLVLKLFASITNVFTNIFTGEFAGNFGGFISSDNTHLPWIIIPMILIGSFIGAQIGPIINNKISNKIMTRFFYTVMLAVILWESAQAILIFITGTTII